MTITIDLYTVMVYTRSVLQGLSVLTLTDAVSRCLQPQVIFFNEVMSMTKSAMTHARLTPEVKKKAEGILRELGISISSAYEMFYRQIIAQRGLPFDVRIPKKTTIQAMEEAREGKGEKYDNVEELFIDMEI